MKQPVRKGIHIQTHRRVRLTTTLPPPPHPHWRVVYAGPEWRLGAGDQRLPYCRQAAAFSGGRNRSLVFVPPQTPPGTTARASLSRAILFYVPCKVLAFFSYCTRHIMMHLVGCYTLLSSIIVQWVSVSVGCTPRPSFTTRYWMHMWVSTRNFGRWSWNKTLTILRTTSSAFRTIGISVALRRQKRCHASGCLELG